MRFMVIVKSTKESEAGVLPNQKLLADMGKYNEELVKARGIAHAQQARARAAPRSRPRVRSLSAV